MCLLSYYPAGVMPVREHLENGARLNPHGSGFAAGWDLRRSMDSEKAIDGFLAARMQTPFLPAMFHARNATGDSPVTPENIHPFRVSLRGKDAFVAHNGYLFPHDGDRSDSAIFAEEILPRYDLDDPDEVALLERRMGPSRAVVLFPASRALILNAHLGICLPDGTWHSNRDYLGEPHVIPGVCPVCKAETDLKPVCETCEGRAQRRRALLMEKEMKADRRLA
jgi:hypothetical protein